MQISEEFVAILVAINVDFELVQDSVRIFEVFEDFGGFWGDAIYRWDSELKQNWKRRQRGDVIGSRDRPTTVTSSMPIKGT